MKVTRSFTIGFTPFTLNITVETEEEARALYAIFNHRLNSRLHRGCDQIARTIGAQYTTEKNSDVIANGVTDSEFYK